MLVKDPPSLDSALISLSNGNSVSSGDLIPEGPTSSARLNYATDQLARNILQGAKAIIEKNGQGGTTDLKNLLDLLDKFLMDWQAEGALIENLLPEDDTHIASRIVGHDLPNYFTALSALRVCLNLDMDSGKDVSGNLKKLFTVLGILKTSSAAMGLLCSPIDPASFREAVSSEEAKQMLLHGRNDDQLSVSLPLDQVYTSELFVLEQLVKNATRFSNQIWVTCRGYREGALFEVHDYGPGILKSDGQPLDNLHLHSIFGSFSTREGGGLGLRIMASLIGTIEGGAYRVVSVPEDGLARVYASDDNSFSDLPFACHKGTQFWISVPHAANPPTKIEFVSFQ